MLWGDVYAAHLGLWREARFTKRPTKGLRGWSAQGKLTRLGRVWVARLPYHQHGRVTRRLCPPPKPGRIISYTMLRALYQEYGKGLNDFYLQTTRGPLPALVCLRLRLGGAVAHLGA